MKRTLQENLETSEKTLENVARSKPEQEEKKAIKFFCNEEVRRKLEADKLNDSLVELRAAQKSLKSKLAQIKTCVMISKEDNAKYEKMCSSLGIPQMPPYLRVLRTNKDGTITPEVIQEAIDSLTPQDIAEKKDSGNEKEVIRDAILQAIRRVIRTFSETNKLMTSIPRGMTTYDIETAKPEVSELMFQYWKTDHEIKGLLSSKKIDPELNKQQNDLKDKIESYFIRAGITAQRIVVDTKPYRLVRRISVRKTKVGIGQIQKMLEEILEGISVESFKPNEVTRQLQILLTSMPPETKTCIKLCAVKEESGEK